jgi:DNA mismatch repair ATPase MutS
MATHQDSLAQSAATCKTAANYHFQEELIETGIQFNYRLQPGPASTKTAIRILEQEGYPISFLERARRLMLLD